MGMSQKMTENGSFRAIGIDLGTTNSVVTKIVCDPALKQTHKIVRQRGDRSCQPTKD
jgi:molecular chaperone DnaK (HSP70)